MMTEIVIKLRRPGDGHEDIRNEHASGLRAVAVACAGLAAVPAQAAIDGITGTTFNFTAKADYISDPRRQQHPHLGLCANGTAPMQYPGPTLIVNQGDTVTITLTEPACRCPVSIVFPGQARRRHRRGAGPADPGGAPSAGRVTYTFTRDAARDLPLPQRHADRTSRSRWGSSGAIIVRPAGSTRRPQAYNHAATRFDHEYLFLLTEMDPTSTSWSTRAASARWTPRRSSRSTGSSTAALPRHDGRAERPPGCPPSPTTACRMMHPGEKVLLRMVGGGRDAAPLPHPRQPHERDRPRRQAPREHPGSGPDLAGSASPPRRPRRDGRRDLHLDRREARLGHLRPSGRRQPADGRISPDPRTTTTTATASSIARPDT